MTVNANKTRVSRLRDVQPQSQHAHIKGDGSFPHYNRIISTAKEFVRRKRMKDLFVAEDFVERIVSHALDELKPEDLDSFDERAAKIARRVFDGELQHHRWTEPATETFPSSLPASSVHGTTEQVLRDVTGEPLTHRPSRSKVIIASPVKLAEPDDDGNEWSSLDDLAFADSFGRGGGTLRGQNQNVAEDRIVAKLDRDNAIRRLVKIITLDDLRFLIGYRDGDLPRTAANRQRFSRIRLRLKKPKKLFVTNRRS